MARRGESQSRGDWRSDHAISTPSPYGGGAGSALWANASDQVLQKLYEVLHDGSVGAGHAGMGGASQRPVLGTPEVFSRLWVLIGQGRFSVGSKPAEALAASGSKGFAAKGDDVSTCGQGGHFSAPREQAPKCF